MLTLTDPDGPSGPAAAAVDHSYLYGPAVDQILADEQVESGSTPPTSRVLWTLTDHQHTVRDLSARDAATDVATVVAHRQFDSSGKITAGVNPSDSSATVVDTLFGYTGREFDPETGLAYVRARYYDPALDQFDNEDPLGWRPWRRKCSTPSRRLIPSFRRTCCSRERLASSSAPYGNGRRQALRP